ncbi:MAG: RdgB/HAM1 family non-canonical purine NTP pyrophosphatase [Parvibaculaceae bacterium]|nr:RdgB/HAM1 family non-canonical purine NTP pyrophosphatase [Parvibaculaceae bacterium]
MTDAQNKQSHRQLEKGKLVVASHNAGKVREIRDLLAPFGIEPISAGDLGLPEPEETGTTFQANAELKALAAATAANLPALADDSGLAVNILEGAPGIYSARWAGPEKDFSMAMEEVEKAIREAGAHDRSAHFVCGLALAWPDGHVEYFEGTVDGTIVSPPRGDRGFGYDPIFQPLRRLETFAEIEPNEKHAMSHRAHAFRKLTSACFGR